MFVVTLKFLKPREELLEHLPGHYKFLDKYYQQGVFIASGPKIERDGGVIIVNNVTRQQLVTLLSEDPLQKFNLSDYFICEFTANRGQFAE